MLNFAGALINAGDSYIPFDLLYFVLGNVAIPAQSLHGVLSRLVGGFRRKQLGYRSFHFQHHVYTKTERDPEPQDPPSTRLGFAVAAPLADVALNALLWRELVRVLAGRPSAYARRTARRGLATVNVAAVLGFVAGVYAVSGSWTRLAAVWAIPAALGTVLGGLAVAGEHYGCVRETDDMFLNSRTVKSNRVVRFFLWNANYHTAHHLAPTVTGRNLPQLHVAIDDRCAFVERSFSSFYGKTLHDPLHAERRSAELVREAADVIDAESAADYAARAGARR